MEPEVSELFMISLKDLAERKSEILFLTLSLLISGLNEREDFIEEALNRAKKARNEMQELTAENERIVKEAKAERDSILREAREIKEKTIAD